MELLDTIQNMKKFHADWESKEDPALDFNHVCQTLENAIKELEKFDRILNLVYYKKHSKSYASTALSEIRAISIEKLTQKLWLIMILAG